MILMNFVPIKAGGGLQNTLSFLYSFAGSKYMEQLDYCVICSKGSHIESFCLQHSITFVTVNGSFFGRLYYETMFGARLIKRLKGTILFSLFGSAPIVCPKVYKISGFAYSNIIQSDIPFWDFLPWRSKLVKIAIDAIRLYQAKKSDDIILETKYLSDRARASVFNKMNVHVIQMAPSPLLLQNLSEITKSAVDARTKVEVIRLLYLSGPHPNKRIHDLAPIFLNLKKIGLNCLLVTTLPSDSTYFKMVLEKFSELGVRDMLENIGPIAADKIHSIIGDVNGMINVSLLESFSNNWVEAWAAQIPLIVTDADWARASCGNGALYVDIKDPGTSAVKIATLYSSNDSIERLCKDGLLQLKDLPTTVEKFESYMDIINRATTSILRREGV